MSGIAAMLDRDGRPADPDVLTPLLSAMADRGPDRQQRWAHGPVALGHALLRIDSYEPERGQPLSDERLGLTVALDGRVDNRAELWDQLGLPPRSDAALAIAAYQAWGENCVQRFLGDFALVLWDAGRRTLFCARDQIGVRPLLYADLGRCVAVASDIRALLAMPGMPRRLDELHLADYLTYNGQPIDSTFYRAIKRLPPAHTLTVGPEGVRRRRYWTLPFPPTLRLASNEEYAERFRSIFFQAVSCRVPAASPAGSMLSGGLDSTSVACVAGTIRCREGVTAPLPVYSFVVPQLPEADERRYIDAALARGNFIPHFIDPLSLDPLAHIDAQIPPTGVPTLAAINTFAFWEAMESARADGIRILLGGTDGDNVVSHGPGVLADQLRHGQWIALWRNARNYPSRTPMSPARAVWVHAVRPHLPGPALELIRRARRRPIAPPVWRNVSLLREDVIDRLDFAGHYEEVGGGLPPPRNERIFHHQYLNRGYYPVALEGLDSFAANFGMEIRLPFMDRRLVEFCLSLPPEQRLQDGWSRYVLRRAMEGILPPDVQWRRDKANFSMVLTTQLARCNRSQLEAFAARPDVLAPWVDIDRLRATYRRFLAEPNADLILPVWTTFTLGYWLEKMGYR